MTFEQITPAFLAAVLETSRAVADVHWERIGEERGFSSTLARVTYTLDGEPNSLIAKANAKENEVRAYRELARFAAMPRYLGGEPGGLLLIEDVPGTPGDANAGCSADELARVLEAIAPVHAAFWDRAPDWPGHIGSDPTAAQELHDARVAMFLDRYADRVSPAMRERIERLAPEFGAALASMATSPTTLLHADLHLDNVLFGDRVTILDWESPAVGKAVYDVALLFFSSLDAGERRAHGDEVLRKYHRQLAAPGYEYARFSADLRAGLHVMFGATINGIARRNPETCTAGVRAWIEETLRPGRLFQAVGDLL